MHQNILEGEFKINLIYIFNMSLKTEVNNDGNKKNSP